VLSREGQSGTDAMITRLGPDVDSPWAAVGRIGAVLGGLAERQRGADGERTDARGAILFKGPKPDQDRRADLPVIGVQTAKGAVAAGFAGIVISHDGVMVLDLPAVVEALDNAGLFLWVRHKGGV
jgi:DUF1009 family protein